MSGEKTKKTISWVINLQGFVALMDFTPFLSYLIGLEIPSPYSEFHRKNR